MIIILRLIILVAALIAGVAGIAGAPGGGWGATRLPLPRHGSVNLPTWLTAIAGAAVLLPACHLVTGRAGQRMAHR
jgi:uncharacterized membrane protein YeaQ/YmgE (transglycosylase-associated protein family)